MKLSFKGVTECPKVFKRLNVCILRNTQDCQNLLPIYPFIGRSFKTANLPTNALVIKKYQTKAGVVKVTCYVIRCTEQEQGEGGSNTNRPKLKMFTPANWLGMR